MIRILPNNQMLVSRPLSDRVISLERIDQADMMLVYATLDYERRKPVLDRTLSATIIERVREEGL